MPRPPVNFRLEMTEAPPSPFADADELASRYGFDPAFPLRDRLDVAAGMFRAIRERTDPTREPRIPTAKERRKRLALLEREARAVLDGDIGRADVLAKLLIASGSGGLPTASNAVEIRAAVGSAALARHGLRIFEREDLEALLVQIADARRSLARPRPPISGDGPLRALVYDLGNIWREGTHQRAGRGREGPFPKFLVEVARRLEVPDSREALVKLHARWGK